MSKDNENTTASNQEIIDVESQPGRGEADTLRTVARLLFGLALLGGDAISETLKNAQSQVKEKPSYTFSDEPTQDETAGDQLRYLVVGSLLSTQKRTTSTLKRGINFSLRTTGTVLGTFLAMTDNPVMRPVRRPFEYMIGEMAREADRRVRAGRIEEQKARTSTQESMVAITDTVVDTLVNNPKFKKSVQDVIGSQSMGLAEVMLDSARDATSKTDDTIEGVIRRVLLKKPRRELPASPIAGHSQTMYLPKDFDQEEE